MVEKNQAKRGETERGSVVAGIDVGGTFTDLILIDAQAGGGVRVAKTPTTTDNQAFGVVAALADTGFPVAEINLIVHGTTTTTNAVAEQTYEAPEVVEGPVILPGAAGAPGIADGLIETKTVACTR